MCIRDSLSDNNIYDLPVHPADTAAPPSHLGNRADTYIPVSYTHLDVYKRQHPSFTFRHWAGVSTYTSAFALAGTCVYGKQSLGPLLCDHSMLHPHGTSQQWLPLSRSYGYILPSSLTRVLPRTLGFSPRIPVSVYGTGGSSLTRSFSRQCGVNNFARISAHSASRLRLSVHGFAYAPPYTLTHALPFACLPALLCHSIAQTITTGTGISTSCPSPTLSASD